MMEYLDAREQRTQRVIVPLEVRRRSGELILIAHCQLRNDRRTFKLERVVELRAIASEAPQAAVPATATNALVLTAGEDSPKIQTPSAPGE